MPKPKKETLRDRAKTLLNSDLEERKVTALARLLNSRRRHEASIKQIDEEIKGIEESPADTSFIPEGENMRW